MNASGISDSLTDPVSCVHRSGSDASVIAGVQFANNHRLQYGLTAVFSLSLGGGTSNPLDAAINEVVSAGVPVAVAAGNDDADACLSSPARAEQAITVGATGRCPVCTS